MLKEGLEINIIFIIVFGAILLVITTLVILFVTFNNRRNKLIQEKLEHALEHQQKLHDLELSALRNQMNPHFIHNSLNAIQYYVQRNDVETSEFYLTKFSKLMRLFFDYSSRQSITLKEEIALLKNYLQIEKLRFEENLTYTINVDKNLTTEVTEIPSMILQPLVENAINHGLFHKKGIGTLAIEFKEINNKCFLVLIVDNGIGINKSLAKNTSIKKNKHSSSVIEERLNLLKESNNWDIDFKIVDRSINENTSGTIVTLTFNQME
ncbi:Histidine kinase [Lutibacter oricola]|uniref:Histidine kinase n=1 Tax=Lutibacter oricola TaxID=762486 RepID=A0A1H3D1R0_9FLAO|nr:histidine kinase [Lutibacter oricola]SDX60337.1 Histidine kinase [Lutibacter oricola]